MRVSSEDNNTRGKLTYPSREEVSLSNLAYLDTDAVRRRAMTGLGKDVGRVRAEQQLTAQATRRAAHHRMKQVSLGADLLEQESILQLETRPRGT